MDRAFLMESTQQVIPDGTTFQLSLESHKGRCWVPYCSSSINDLPEYIKHCKVRLFANDCVLYRPILNRNDTLLVQADLHALKSWSQDWLMNFNASKCYSMKLSQSRNSIEDII